MEVLQRPIREITPYENNPRNNDSAVDAVAASIREFGWQQPIVVDKDGVIIAGHTRYKAARKLGLAEVPVVVADKLTEEQIKAYRLADNKSGELADWDFSALEKELAGIAEIDMSQFGFDSLDDIKDKAEWEQGAKGISLSDKYLFPPFSVLDGRNGKWLDRKKQWHYIIGADSRNGRDQGLISEGMRMLGKLTGSSLTGTSEFDPVLCETLIRWFCPPGGKIIDPFSGGNVRGIVSMLLGAIYHGVDIRQEQITENYDSLETVRNESNETITPRWYCGDSAEINTILGDEAPFDFFLMCPPYGDLEKYSDDPNDLSNMPYGDFIRSYRDIISKTVSLLADNAFCAVVVSDIRDKKGMYRGFTMATIEAFESCGCHFYNDIVKLDSLATAAILADGQFSAARKVVRTHQNVLVFVKGDPRKIKLNEYNFDFDGYEETSEEIE